MFASVPYEVHARCFLFLSYRRLRAEKDSRTSFTPRSGGGQTSTRMNSNSARYASMVLITRYIFRLIIILLLFLIELFFFHTGQGSGMRESVPLQPRHRAWIGPLWPHARAGCCRRCFWRTGQFDRGHFNVSLTWVTSMSENWNSNVTFFASGHFFCHECVYFCNSL